MIMPSRWFTGGRGLDDFRKKMLNDDSIRVLHDYISSNSCFSNVEIKGGICYFLWDKKYHGYCDIYTHYENNKEIFFSQRHLLEKASDCFIRDGRFISILKKIQQKKEISFSTIVSANDPFGFDIREENSYKRVKLSFSTSPFDNSVKLYYNGWAKNGIGFLAIDKIRKNIKWLNSHKMLFPKAWGNGDASTDRLKPIIADLPSCCTETYLIVGPFLSSEETNNAYKYTQTKLFHCLVFLIKNTQNTMQKAYSYVPLQNFTKQSDIDWNKSIPEIDQQLYTKYHLTTEEIAFIEKMIKQM